MSKVYPRVREKAVDIELTAEQVEQLDPIFQSAATATGVWIVVAQVTLRGYDGDYVTDLPREATLTAKFCPSPQAMELAQQMVRLGLTEREAGGEK